jgi:hypothetical protein
MNTESAHLDLQELLAEVDGGAVSDLAREHLTACGRCHDDALRWGAVAGGVRELMTASSPVPALAGLPAQAGRRPRSTIAAAAAAAAAAVLVLGGTGYGLTTALSGHLPGTSGASTAAALTAVSGCTAVKQAFGILDQVNGTSLVVKTAGGQLVTLTVTASTLLSVSGAPLGDITNGASIAVAGAGSGGTIAATTVVVGWPQSGGKTLGQPGSVAAEGTPWSQTGPTVGALRLPGGVAAEGTVADVGPGGFTVVTATGARVRVATSSATSVTVYRASPSQLRVGAAMVAVGRPGPGQTLAAITALQPAPGSGRLNWQVRGCSAASLDTAMTAAALTAG